MYNFYFYFCYVFKLIKNSVRFIVRSYIRCSISLYLCLFFLSIAFKFSMSLSTTYTQINRYYVKAGASWIYFILCVCESPLGIYLKSNYKPDDFSEFAAPFRLKSINCHCELLLLIWWLESFMRKNDLIRIFHLQCITASSGPGRFYSFFQTFLLNM